ncbi:hypothetical protein I5M32_02100 [Pedobacter sp. SD-b]|uniref:DUF5723 domain-containing protein n=1 Tax=Pedobacter segetis TaxID=2793069 RepID=A0ABS1BFU9_9SPHI|nr:hypothetical protein [Pedobacter segetis]MBK0381740.1 hypothetical protein [Pedobacter segetis]
MSSHGTTMILPKPLGLVHYIMIVSSLLKTNMKKCILLGAFGLAFMINPVQAQDFTNLKNEKPFNFSGNIQARGISYNANGIPDRRKPLSYYLVGSPTFSFYGFTIPVSFTFSEVDRSFRQPFNQFGISPTYKWLTLHGGYRNLNFSPYTLGGHTILGAGFEMKPGKLRLGFMYGRLNRATTIDTTTQALVPFSFSRKAYAAKLGYGSDKNFFEFSYLSAKDDDKIPDNLPNQLNIVNPASNNVLGYSYKFTLFKNILFESDGAASLYTKDYNSSLSLDSFDNPVLNQAKKYFSINATTEFYTAISAALVYKGKNYQIKLGYKRIDPDFKTMGAYYFNSDLENYILSPSATLFKGKARLSGSLGLQHDNLKNQKRAQNNRVIGSANLSYEVNKSLGFDVVYSNFSDNQRAKTVLYADSIKIVQTTQTIGLMPRYFITSTNATHAISASASINTLRDFNNFFGNDAASRNINTTQFFINYNLGFPQKNWSVFINLNNTNLKGAGLNSKFLGATLGGNTFLIKNKLQAGITNTLTQSDANQNKSFIINASGNLNYKVDKRQNLGFNFYFTNNKAKSLNAITPNFSETRSELSYSLNF